MRTSISRRGLLAASLAAAPATIFAQAAPAGRVTGPLRLIANENPYGPSPAAREALQAAVADSWKYAMREVGELKRQLASLHDLDADQVMVCAGSTEALRVSALLYARQGGQVVAARPTFSFLPDYARALGCTVAEVPLDDAMTHDLDAMAAAVSADTRLLYVCNPNNPTGTLIKGDQLNAFLAELTPRVPVLVDEAYLDLDEKPERHSAITRVRAGDAVIVTRTFSKLHGMAGLRVGYAIAPPAIIEKLEALRISQMNYPGVLAASASLDDTDWLEFSRARIREGLAVTSAVLDQLGLDYRASHGNFVFFDTRRPSRQFMAAMGERGILTGMPSRDYPGWARISMGKVTQMQTLAEAMRDYYSTPA